MADVQLLANQASSLIQTLDATTATRNPFEYSYPKDLANSNIPNHSVSYQVIQPNSTKAFNSANDFNLPKQGFLTKLYLKLALKNTSGATVYHSQALAPLIVNEIELLTQGRRIYHQTSDSLFAYTSSQPYQTKKALEEAMQIKAAGDAGGEPLANGATLTAYIPVLFYCFQSVCASLHTDFLENLVCRTHLGNIQSFCATDISGSSAASLDLETLELVGEYRRVPAQVEQQIVEYNYKEGNLILVNNDPVIETETKTLSSSNKDISITLNTNRCVQKMYVMVDRQAASPLNEFIDNRAEFMELDSIKFEAGGQTIIPDTVDAAMLQLLGQHSVDERGVSMSNHWDSSLGSTSNIYEINFGLSKDMKRNSNAVSFRELTNAKITATVKSPASKSYTITVVMVCAGLLSVSSASGRITQALNS